MFTVMDLRRDRDDRHRGSERESSGADAHNERDRRHAGRDHDHERGELPDDDLEEGEDRDVGRTSQRDRDRDRARPYRGAKEAGEAWIGTLVDHSPKQNVRSLVSRGLEQPCLTSCWLAFPPRLRAGLALPTHYHNVAPPSQIETSPAHRPRAAGSRGDQGLGRLEATMVRACSHESYICQRRC
jgi:hypothetical protein